jgi:hypothetical protein
MNKTGFQIKNNYFSVALYMKLIVDNMKYRGIQCDFGRLTDVFFVTPDSLSIAVQRDTDFFQYTYDGRVFKPAQKGVLKKAGFALHKCNITVGKERIEGRILFLQRTALSGHSESAIRRKFGSSKFRVQGSRIRNLVSSIQHPVSSIQHLASLKENSTVINYIKPSATETRFPAEGCISESRAIRACLMIRVFNN